MKDRNIVFKSVIFCMLIQLVLSGCSGKLEIEAVAERETICYQSVFQQTIQGGDRIGTNYLNQGYEAAWARGNEVLSESQGLGMKYLLRIRDKNGYNKLLSFLKAYMNQSEGLSYRYAPNQEYAYSMNALIDDLRIIDALLEGAEVFQNNSYKRLANNWSKRLYDTNVLANRLYDFYDWELEMRNEFITLCYIDLATIDKMSEYDTRWQAVRKEMLPILEGGYIGDDFPMFRTRYHYGMGQYEVDESINMVEATLTTLHLAQIGRCSEKTIDFLKEKVTQGNLYTHYSLKGEAVGDVQSTAIYAICALIASELEDEVFYEQSIARMNQWQVLNPESEIYGAFGNEETLEVYAFDNLMALLAYRVR